MSGQYALAFSFVGVVCCFRIRRRPLTDAEKNRILEEDFALDSGGAKVVDEKKVHAVFQAADQWVENIDAAQYAEFLERAYDVVCRELVERTRSSRPIVGLRT